MGKIFDYFISIIVAIILFFGLPLLYFSLKQDELTEVATSDIVSDFVDNVQTHGYLTKEMYEVFLEKLNTTNVIYNIHLKHKVLAIEPKYRLKTADEVKDDQNSAYKGKNIYTYREVKTEVPTVTDPVNTVNLNTETNESIMATAVNTPADPNHVHTKACYGGGDYDVNPDVWFNGGSGPSEWGPGNRVGTYYWVYMYCSHCGNMIATLTYEDNDQWDNASAYNFSSDQIQLGLSYMSNGISYSSCKCAFTKWETRWETTYTPPQDNWTFIEYKDGYFVYRRINPNWYSIYLPAMQKALSGSYYPDWLQAWEQLGFDPTYICPDCGSKLSLLCNQMVTSIVPTNPVQTVAVGERLITTVKLTYLDGSTKTVIATTNFSTVKITTSQTATLTYSYTVNGKSYSKNCNVTVTVVPKTKTCINGHTYNLNTDGSDPGCPYCKAWLKSLSVINPNTNSITIFKGTSLEDNGVSLLAIYLDGHKKYLYNGYVDNLDTNYVGSQNVTISYKGKYINLTVITKRNLKKCTVCGKYYELYPDGTDPGCPYCAAKIPIFTGSILKYYATTYSSKILDELYNGNGIYYFNTGDYFSIKVTNKSTTLGTRFMNFIVHNMPAINIQIEKGAPIRNGFNSTD